MIRYGLAVGQIAGSNHTYSQMYQADNGDYVKYADAKRELEKRDTAYRELLVKYTQLLALNEEQP